MHAYIYTHVWQRRSPLFAVANSISLFGHSGKAEKWKARVPLNLGSNKNGLQQFVSIDTDTKFTAPICWIYASLFLEDKRGFTLGSLRFLFPIFLITLYLKILNFEKNIEAGNIPTFVQSQCYGILFYLTTIKSTGNVSQ